MRIEELTYKVDLASDAIIPTEFELQTAEFRASFAGNVLRMRPLREFANLEEAWAAANRILDDWAVEWSVIHAFPVSFHPSSSESEGSSVIHAGVAVVRWPRDLPPAPSLTYRATPIVRILKLLLEEHQPRIAVTAELIHTLLRANYGKPQMGDVVKVDRAVLQTLGKLAARPHESLGRKFTKDVLELSPLETEWLRVAARLLARNVAELESGREPGRLSMASIQEVLDLREARLRKRFPGVAFESSAAAVDPGRS